MSHYLIELAIWMLAIFLIGCLIGAILRKLVGRPAMEATIEASAVEQDAAAVTATRLAEAQEPPPGQAPMAPRWSMAAEEASEPEPAEAETVVPVVAAAASTISTATRMPVGIAGPRGGRPDNLQRISGVGPKNEQILHSLGFYHFDQIAQWTEQHVDWVDGYLRFNGRIARENWVDQCKLLADGDEEEFARLYGTGGLADASGQTKSGERTRLS